MALAEIVHRGWRLIGVPGVAVAAVGVAFAGGALSGWTQHGPHTSAGPPISAGVGGIAGATSTTVDITGQAKRDIVDDLGTDLTSQALDPNLLTRRGLATTPDNIAARHRLVEVAWAPDQVARVEAEYDHLVVVHASDPTVPSVTDATFVVLSWQEVTITGPTARAVVVGHFRLHEPGNVAARAVGGYVSVFDRTWTVAASLSGGRWRLEGRSAA